jgi:CubicO group peptidase (beta-lactamase class C family)
LPAKRHQTGMKHLLLLSLALLACAAPPTNGQSNTISPANLASAAQYSVQNREDALLIVQDGKILLEKYSNGYSATKAHYLASGTKSFWGVAAAAASEDGLLQIDELVSDTITEWKTDARKSRITIRQLLTLTSGIDAGDTGMPPAYAVALQSPAKFEPGRRWEYGPVPYQVFGELLKRKLKTEHGLDYLKRRIFAPIGLNVDSWTMNRVDENPNIPSGAFLTAPEWLKFGQLLLGEGQWQGKTVIKWENLKTCFVGTEAKAGYGLTFWLGPSLDGFAALPNKLPVWLAQGAGNQRLMVLPQQRLIVVRFGENSPFNDAVFLKRLLTL